MGAWWPGGPWGSSGTGRVHLGPEVTSLRLWQEMTSAAWQWFSSFWKLSETFSEGLHLLYFKQFHLEGVSRECIYLFFFFFCFLGLHLQHTEVPRLGVELELWPPAYATATATPDP